MGKRELVVSQQVGVIADVFEPMKEFRYLFSVCFGTWSDISLAFIHLVHLNEESTR